MPSSADIPEQFRVPEDYDFSTRGMDWNQFKDDFIIRTDAVWEKQKLIDFFRVYSKPFLWDYDRKGYAVFEPEDQFTYDNEPEVIESTEDFKGITPTGRTNCFQYGLGPREKMNTPTYITFLSEDYYRLFERWYFCDMGQSHLMEKAENDALVNDDFSLLDQYPCYQEFYEVLSACSDVHIDFLMELHHTRIAANYRGDFTYSNQQFKHFPVIYDSPKYEKTKTLTY